MLSRLPNLKTLSIVGRHVVFNTDPEFNMDDFLDIIKLNNSVTKAVFNLKSWTRPRFQDEVDSFCILNKVFGTNLMRFGPTDLWTLILSKVMDDSALENLLFRLLREKPELVVGVASVTHQEVCRAKIAPSHVLLPRQLPLNQEQESSLEIVKLREAIAQLQHTVQLQQAVINFNARQLSLTQKQESSTWRSSQSC